MGGQQTLGTMATEELATPSTDEPSPVPCMDFQDGPLRYDVYNDDCRRVFPIMPRGVARVAVTDPPYRIQWWDAFGASEKGKYLFKPLEYAEWIPAIRDVLTADGSIYIFEHPNNLPELLAEVCKHFTYRGQIIWNVTNRHMVWKTRWYYNHYDMCIWATVGDTYVWNGKGRNDLQDVFSSPTVTSPSEAVRGMKPIRLLRKFIAVSSDPGDVVIDPFLGSGSTMLAARMERRSCIGIERNPGVMNIIRTKALLDIPDIEGWRSDG